MQYHKYWMAVDAQETVIATDLYVPISAVK